MSLLLLLALAIPLHAADSDGMLRDYAAALESRGALDRELDRRIALFEKEVAGIEKELDRDSLAAAERCKTAADRGARLSQTSDALEKIRAELSLSLSAVPQPPCDGYALRRAETLFAASTAPASEIDPLLSRAQYLARTRIQVRAQAQAAAAPWDQRPGRLALLSDQAQSLRTLFEEARQRLDAARVTRNEIQRLSDKNASPPEPETQIDYASRERAVIDDAFARLTSKIGAMNCGPATAPTAARLDAAAEGARSAFQQLSAEVDRCRADAAAALGRELADAPAIAAAIALEERAYEEERKRHLERDLEEWARRRKRELRRLAQQRRFAKTMRPPRRRDTEEGTGKKGPWLAWGSQAESDAPIRLRISDVDDFDADPSPYKRLLRPRTFRTPDAARAWLCDRLAGIRERPVLGRSAEFGDEIVSLGGEILCD